MRRVEAKIVENRKEDPASEPAQDPNTWLIEAKPDEDVLDRESGQTRFLHPKSSKSLGAGAGDRCS